MVFGLSQYWCLVFVRSCEQLLNKAFKSDSQRLAFSLRSSIAKRRSHLNAALAVQVSVISKIVIKEKKWLTDMIVT